MPSKHTYLTQSEWQDIKDALSRGGSSQRDIAYDFNRSDQLIRQVKTTATYFEYRNRYLKRLDKATKFEYENKMTLDLDHDAYIHTDVMKEGHMDKVMAELKSINEQLNAIAYVLRKELK
jgi:hypothetical protein